MDHRVVLGLVATALALIGYIPYTVNIIKGRTKPHAFTWLIWAVLTAIAFAGQVTDNAGPGSWVMGFTAAVSFAFCAAAFVRGEKNITRSDWICLAAATVALLLWVLTSGPLLSVILVTLIDAVAFLPTFRKSWHKPHEETALTYFLSGIKFVISLFALENFTVVTWLYPASLVLMNLAFVAMVLARRRALNSSPQTSG